MSVPLSQMWTVASYVLRQKIRGRRRYPLVLMLEPLMRCNLSCAGCGKIQYPARILKQQLTPQECFDAAEECGAPMVSIPGGEPLLHPQIKEIVEGLTARGKYVYLCTNAILLKEKLDLFTPNKRLTFSVHMDGQREHHDFSVCREGVYDQAIEGMREAVRRGFRVTTNTTLFDGADPKSVRSFFDEMMDVGVEGMMVSPGYSYEAAPDQENFLGRENTKELFSAILSNRKERWAFNQSPLFLEFLMGRREYHCTPWGMPTYNIFGWQKPCYLLQDGYADSFAELMEATAWEKYGHESGNPKCANCMVHSGYEASAVDHTFGSLRGLLTAAKATLFGGSYEDEAALKKLDELGARPSLVSVTVAGAAPGPEASGSDERPREAPVENGPSKQQDADAEAERTDDPYVSYEGWTPDLRTDDDVSEALEKAFAYRGDVSVSLRDGTRHEGYIFDRDAAGGRVRLLAKDSDDHVEINAGDIAGLDFTGKDTARGKSFEAWVKRYQKMKAKRA